MGIGKWIQKTILTLVLGIAIWGMLGVQSNAATSVGIKSGDEMVTFSGFNGTKTITLQNTGKEEAVISCNAGGRVTVSPATMPISAGGEGTFTVAPAIREYGTFENQIVFSIGGSTDTLKARVNIWPSELKISASERTAAKGGVVALQATADGASVTSGVSWSVTGSKDGSSTITNGKLTVGATETATSLTIQATYSQGGSPTIPSQNSIVIDVASSIFRVAVKTENTDKGTVSGGGAVAQNGSITIYANPNSNCSFVGWYLDGKQVSNSATYTVTNVTKNGTYEARFIGRELKIKVKKNIDAAGTVSDYKTVRYGDSVTVRVKSVAEGYRFKGWKEGSDYLTRKEKLTLDNVKEDRTVVATFEVVDSAQKNQTPTLSSCVVTLNNEPVAGGNYAGSGVYNPGTDVVIVATPAAGYRFVGWRYNGEIFTNAQNYVLKNISQSYQITAVYEKQVPAGKKTSSLKTENAGKVTAEQPEKTSDTDKSSGQEQVEEEIAKGILAQKNMTKEQAREALAGNQGMELLELAQKENYLQIYVQNDMKENGSSHSALVGMEAPGILNLDTVIGDLLTEEEKLQILQGQKALIEVELSSISYSISEKERKTFEEYAGKDLQIATYLDLSLFKTIDEHKKAVTQIQNGMIVVLDIPEEFRDETDERQYFIIRKHVKPDGSVLMSVLEDMDSSASTITFSTDKFSTYALAYSGDEISRTGADTVVQNSKQYYALFLVIGVMGVITLITIVITIASGKERETWEESQEQQDNER